MRRYFYILAALLFLNASTELHQLSGLPFLLQHYRHHQTGNTSISFLEFLKLHYAGFHPDDKDSGEDNRLPFKSTITLLHTDVPVVSRSEMTGPSFKKYIDNLFDVPGRRVIRMNF